MKSHHGTGHSEFTEIEEYNYHPQREMSEDDKNIYTEIEDITNFTLEQATLEENNINNIELDEYDGAQKVKDNDNKINETTPTGEYNSTSEL